MRFLCFAAALVLTFGHLAPAQPPPKADDDLEAILAKWEKAMAGLTKFHIKQATRTTKDITFEETITYKGDVKFLAPRCFLVDLKRVDKGQIKPNDFIRMLSTGKAIYSYNPQKMLISEFPFPVKADAPREENWLSRLRYLVQQRIVGDEGDIGYVPFPLLKVAELKKRYRVTLTPPPAGDRHNHLIEFVPRKLEDRQIIAKARLVLRRATYLPMQFSYEEPNGNQVIWEYPAFLTADADVWPEEFATPKPAPGWTLHQPGRGDGQ